MGNMNDYKTTAVASAVDPVKMMWGQRKELISPTQRAHAAAELREFFEEQETAAEVDGAFPDGPLPGSFTA